MPQVSLLLLALGCRTGKIDGDGGAADAGGPDGGGTVCDGGGLDGGGVGDGGAGDGGAAPDRAWSWGVAADGDADHALVEESAGGLRDLRLASPGDLGGDGRDEVAVGAPFHGVEGVPVGRVYLLSDPAGGVGLAGLPGLLGDPEAPELGGLASLGDLDGDGLAELGASTGVQGDPDLAVVLWGGGPATAAALPLASADVGFVAREGGREGAELELRAWSGDHTGDGRPDLVALDAPDTTLVLAADALAAETLVPDAAWASVRSEERLYLAGSGDLDGDGLADLVFTDLSGSDGSFLVPGGTAPTDTLEASGQPLVQPGPDVDVRVTLLPDLDGDGDAELLLSDGEQTHGLCLGRPDLPVWTAIDQCEVQLPAGEAAGVGDLDGDGLEDLALKIQAITTATDWLVLYFGREAWPEGFLALPPDVTLLSGTAGSEMGAMPSPDQRGDLDGDGLDDLVLADPEAAPGGRADAGEVRVVRGRRTWPAEILLDEAELRVQGGAAGVGLGSAVALADLDGDGRGDLVLGEGPAADGSQPGRVLVFLGQPQD